MHILNRRTFGQLGFYAFAASSAHAAPSSRRRKVILDTDPGVDDAMALLFLHFAPDVELVGITTASGNGLIATTTHNARYLAETFGITVPVAQGQGPSLDGVVGEAPVYVHGRNALGNVPEPARLNRALDPRPAHRFIIDMLRASPGEITLIAIGRMTNLALALREDPAIASFAKQVIIMGGAFGTNGVLGNVTPAAEANFAGDPRAADEVVGAAWPVTVVGLDVTTRTMMNDAWLARLRDRGGPASKFIWDVTRFYMDFHHRRLGLDAIYVNDSSAVAFFLDPSLFSVRRGAIRVVTEGIAAGESILKPAGRRFPANGWDGRPDQAACIDVDSERLKALYARTLLGH
ncbi:nucleoside hydrolase [Tanticharoenia sakaeratensis]|uniref:Uridine nucleosidase 1 n=1 Tax=Tanticharoenia sakaeratensis NBRC 103193 TaxID=1231623 RepID=A0A0D6MNP9_9PROT|nr:nucleoside hydrolase [Tanticharoenia sakaeratensis]GAN55040.1 uridine nucleosidase 1 [Tanticharoenia sakaeratensis NBRC 103193]GBQ20040.1 inosine-uridine preferring nucleoside hydrolase [Tanticharoenia sakaeratensis NBRC 103193]